jgi:hypothetical protein
MSAAPGFPSFLIIGTGRAGTTSLYHYLAQHPQIFMSPVKEPKFFALEGHSLDFRGPGDERIRTETVTTLVAYRRLFEGVRDEIAVGEASTLYLSHEVAPAAIARHIPHAKLIAVLRDPAERAHSAFQHLTRDGYEPEADFEEALRDEPRRIAAGWYHFWFYRDRGFYHRDLSRYYQFFDPSQIRVYLYDDLERDPIAMVQDIFSFLGVDAGFRPDVGARHNRSGRTRSRALQRFLVRRHPLKEAAKSLVPAQVGHRLISWIQPSNLTRPTLSPPTRASLIAGYREDIRLLEGLIGRDLSAWHRCD